MNTWTSKDMYGAEVTWVAPESAADVSDEILDFAVETTDAWFPEGPIDWESVWDRMEGYILLDKTSLSMGDKLDTPAMRKIQRVVREQRR